jgi:hypothetical protein
MERVRLIYQTLLAKNKASSYRKQIALPASENIPFVVEERGTKYLLERVSHHQDRATGLYWIAVYHEQEENTQT